VPWQEVAQRISGWLSPPDIRSNASAHVSACGLAQRSRTIAALSLCALGH